MQMPDRVRKYAVVQAGDVAGAISAAAATASSCDGVESPLDYVMKVVRFGPIGTIGAADAKACWIFDQGVSGAVPFDLDSHCE